MVTSPTYQLSNILAQKIELFISGSPLSNPWKFKPTKNNPPMTAYNITPIFQSSILFYHKNGGVSKIPELNILEIDQAKTILS